MSIVSCHYTTKVFQSVRWSIRMADSKGKGRDFYELLGLERTANQGQIKHAYRSQKIIFTPKKCVNLLHLFFAESWLWNIILTKILEMKRRLKSSKRYQLAHIKQFSNSWSIKILHSSFQRPMQYCPIQTKSVSTTCMGREMVELLSSAPSMLMSLALSAGELN